jgi:hypothetical protein
MGIPNATHQGAVNGVRALLTTNTGWISLHTGAGAGTTGTYTEGGIFTASTAGTFIASAAFTAGNVVVSGAGASINVTPSVSA